MIASPARAAEGAPQAIDALLVEPGTAEGPHLYRWTRDAYYAVMDAGVLTEGDRVELIEGVILRMAAMKGPHATAVTTMADVLRSLCRPGRHVREQCPIAVSDISEPEPDVAVVRGRNGDYVKEHPRTADLVVEVADTSLAFDLGIKAGLYASAGVPDYWVLALGTRQLHVLRDPESGLAAGNPGGSRYHTVQVFGEAASVSPLFAPHASIAVADLLP